MGFVELELRNVGVRRLRTGAVDRTEWGSVVRGDNAIEEEKEVTQMILLIILLFFPRNL
jgi:hypothetical protein